MMFSIDDTSKKIIVTIQNGEIIEKFECAVSACENPVCTCKNVYLDLSPLQAENKNDGQLPSRRVEVDFAKRTLGYKDQKNVPKEDLEFAELFLSELDEADFKFLHKKHFEFKNRISEEADLDSIDGYFNYHEIEKNGLMWAYNDVLPYGEQLLVTLDGTECIIFDQYCLLPKCSCTDTVLSIVAIDLVGKTGKELCSVSVTYRKKQWKPVEEGSLAVTVKTVKSAIEEQIPDIYKRLLKRHIKLKSIYAHSKKKHFASKQPLQLPKVGRNDPCPCGSGKKYKKCCLKKLN